MRLGLLLRPRRPRANQEVRPCARCGLDAYFCKCTEFIQLEDDSDIIEEELAHLGDDDCEEDD